VDSDGAQFFTSTGTSYTAHGGLGMTGSLAIAANSTATCSPTGALQRVDVVTALGRRRRPASVKVATFSPSLVGFAAADLDIEANRPADHQQRRELGS